jgi:hypothetical protein
MVYLLRGGGERVEYGRGEKWNTDCYSNKSSNSNRKRHSSSSLMLMVTRSAIDELHPLWSTRTIAHIHTKQLEQFFLLGGKLTNLSLYIPSSTRIVNAIFTISRVTEKYVNQCLIFHVLGSHVTICN